MSILNDIFKNYIEVFDKGSDFKGRADRYEFWNFIGINVLIIYPFIIGSLPIFPGSALSGFLWTMFFVLFFIYKNAYFGLILALLAVLIGINCTFWEIFMFMILAPLYGLPQSLPLPALYIRRLNDANCTPVGLVALFAGCFALCCKMTSVALLCFAIMIVLTLLPSKKTSGVWAESAPDIFAKNNENIVADETNEHDSITSEEDISQGENK